MEEMLDAKEFLEYLRPASISKLFGYGRKFTALNKARIAAPDSVLEEYHNVHYEGDHSLPDIAKWLAEQAQLHPEAYLEWPDEEGHYSIQWRTERPYTEEERQEARQWLEDNQDAVREANAPIKLVKFTDLGGTDGS